MEAKQVVDATEVTQSAGKINATYLDQFFTQASEGEKTRLMVFSSVLEASTTDDVKAAIKAWKKGYEAHSKPVRDNIAKRCSEIQALKSAMDVGCVIDSEIGYHANIARALEALHNKGLNGRGKPLSDKEANAIVKKRNATVLKALELAGGDISKLADHEAEAGDALDKEKGAKLAKAIIEKHGFVVAEHCANALLDYLFGQNGDEQVEENTVAPMTVQEAAELARLEAGVPMLPVVTEAERIAQAA